MPQVPIVANPSVMPERASPVYQRLDVDAGAWAAPGRALMGLGESVGSLGATLAANAEKMGNERASADANNAWIAANIEKGQLDAQYFSTEGANAVDGYSGYVESLADIRNRHIAKLGSEKAKKLFDNDFTRSVVTDINAGSRHAATQQKVMVSAASDARVQAAINDSAHRFNSDEAHKNNLLTIDREVENKAKTEGWAPEKLAFEKHKAEGLAWAARIREMAIYNPFDAEKLFKEHMGDLDPDHVPTIENAIRTSRLTGGVKQVVGSVFSGGDVGRPSLVKGMMSLEQYKTDPTANLELVSKGLQNAMARGMSRMPPGVGLKVTEGYTQYGHAPKSKHKIPGVGAVDYTLTLNGKEIPNSGPDTTGLYGRFARATLVELRAHHPELVRHYRYGGTFETSEGSGRADLGHMDVGGAGGPQIGEGARVGAGNIPGGASGLIGRVIGAESGGRGGRVSPAGAVGIMQILPPTAQQAAKQMGIPYSYEHLLNDNSYNVMIGKHILNRLLNKYSGNEVLAVAAYNAGEGRVDEWIKRFGRPNTAEESQAWAGQIPITETRNYVAKVMGSEGVGYDPAPGQAHFTVNNTAGEGRVGGSTEVPWSVRQQQIEAAVEQLGGDPELLERALSAGRTRYNIENAAKEEETQAAYDFVVSTAIANRLTSEEQLLADRAAGEAYKKLDAAKQISVRNLLESLSKDDIPETDAMQQRFYGIKWILNNGTDEQKAKVADPYGPAPKGEVELSNRQKAAIAELRSAKKPKTAATPASAAEKLNVNSLLTLVRPATRAAGLNERANASEEEQKSYAAFAGQFAEELNNLAESHPEKPVTNEEARVLANDLLQKISFEEPWLTWGKSNYPLATSTTEVPLFVMSKQALMDYLGISSDAAEVTMRNEIPSGIRKNLIDDYVRKNGRAPTSEEVIWKIYQRGMFEMQRGSSQQ